MFSGGTVLPDSMETELGTRGFSISRKEYWGSFSAWECVPAAISAGVEILRSHEGVICYDRSVLSGGHKNYLTLNHITLKLIFRNI